MGIGAAVALGAAVVAVGAAVGAAVAAGAAGAAVAAGTAVASLPQATANNIIPINRATGDMSPYLSVPDILSIFHLAYCCFRNTTLITTGSILCYATMESNIAIIGPHPSHLPTHNTLTNRWLLVSSISSTAVPKGKVARAFWDSRFYFVPARKGAEVGMQGDDGSAGEGR